MNRPLALTCLLALVLSTRTSQADTEACAQAYEKAQTYRKDAKLTAARKELVMCAQDKCPAVLRKDCVAWLAQLDETMPQLAFTVRGPDGCDRPDAHVWLDDVEVNEGARGLPIDVDPGPHTLRATVDGASTTRNVVVSSADRRRAVTITFAPESTTCGAPKAPPVPPPASTPPRVGETASDKDKGKTPTMAYLFGGVGLVSLAVGGAFGISGFSQKGTLDDCKGSCAQDDVDTMRRTFLIADAGIGIGVVALAVAGVVYLVTR